MSLLLIWGYMFGPPSVEVQSWYIIWGYICTLKGTPLVNWFNLMIFAKNQWYMEDNHPSHTLCCIDGVRTLRSAQTTRSPLLWAVRVHLRNIWTKCLLFCPPTKISQSLKVAIPIQTSHEQLGVVNLMIWDKSECTLSPLPSALKRSVPWLCLVWALSKISLALVLFLSCSFQNQNLFSQAADAFKLAIHLLWVLCKTGLGLNLCAPLVRRSLVLWFHFQSNFINLWNINKFSKFEKGRIKMTKTFKY